MFFVGVSVFVFVGVSVFVVSLSLSLSSFFASPRFLGITNSCRVGFCSFCAQDLGSSLLARVFVARPFCSMKAASKISNTI